MRFAAVLRFTPGLILFLTVAQHALGAAISWTAGGAGDRRWSNPANWGNKSPAGQDVTFGSTGRAVTFGDITNIVSEDIAIKSLLVNHSGSSSHTTEIVDGKTLSIVGQSDIAPPVNAKNILTIGGTTGVSTGITGAGTLTVNAPLHDILISSTGGTTATLDLTGLATFDATVDTLRLGVGAQSVGVLRLAQDASIVANAIHVGEGATAGNKTDGSTLEIGPAASLRADEIRVGGTRAGGHLRFQSGLNGAEIIIRDKGGAGRAGFTVGANPVASSIGTLSTVDLTAGRVDAKLQTLLIAQGSTSDSAVTTASFAFDEGVVDVVSVVVGQSNSNKSTSNLVDGTLEIGGGALVADDIVIGHNAAGAQAVAGTMKIAGGQTDVRGDILLGMREGTAALVEGRLELTGGVLNVGGDITAGGSKSTLIIDGGTLALSSGSITAGTIELLSGRLAGVSTLDGDVAVGPDFIIAPGASIGTLNVSGDLAPVGGLEIELSGNGASAGTTDLLAVAGLLDLTGTRITFQPLTPLNDAAYVFGSYSGLAGADTVTLANVPTGYQVDFDYQGSNQMAVVAVPEPGSFTAAALAGAAMLLRRRC